MGLTSVAEKMSETMNRVTYEAVGHPCECYLKFNAISLV